MEIRKVRLEDTEYPKMLRWIDDPPKQLYYYGDLSLLNAKCLAIVGARKSSAYGRWVAEKIAARAAEHQITVVSGMAEGIDAMAHQGALKRGGGTVAVLGNGVDICYPALNHNLYETIKKKGLLLSEYPPKTTPRPFQFPRRNRIISGLSSVVVVAEAGLSSGSLITAERAVEQGRDVLAVPGNINARASIGANKLIRDGVSPIVVVDDVLDAMGVKIRNRNAEQDASLGKDEREILDQLIIGGEMSLDQLSRRVQKTVKEVGVLVTILEMKGELVTSFGKVFIAKM